MRLRTALLLTAGAGLLMVAAGAAFLATLDLNRYRDDIAAQVRVLTGRDLTIAGNIQLDVLRLTPALVVENAALSNVPNGSRPDMVRLKRLELQLRLLPLIEGNVEIVSLVLVGPEILLETDRDGRPNWRFLASEAEAGPRGTSAEPGAVPSVEKVRIEDARILYRDGSSGAVVALTLASVTFQSKGMGAPVSLAISGALQNKPVMIEATLGPITDLMAGRAYGGRISSRFGASDLSGSFEAALGEAPIRVAGKLTSNLLDVAELGGEPSGQARRGKLFDAEPIVPDLLRAFAGELDYEARRIVGIGAELTDFKARAELKNGVLALSPITARVADGEIGGDLSAAAQARDLRLALRLKAKGASLAKLSQEFAGTVLATAPVDLDLDLAGSGASVAAIMGALEGHATVVAGAGQVQNGFYDLLSASPLRSINPLAPGEGPPRLNCIVARFDFAGGRGRSRVLVADGSRTTALGHGGIDLRNEYLDILIVPSTKQISAASVASLVPIRLSGPLGSPSLAPDPGQAAMETAKSIIGLAEIPLDIVGSVLGTGRVSRRPGNTCATALAQARGRAAAASGGSAPHGTKEGGLLQRLNPFGR